MLNKDDEDDVERWTFEEIKGHRWSKDKNRKGKVDVLISWKGYEEDSWEPMEVIKKDDPATLAKYAYDNELTDKTVWKWAKRYSKNIKKLKRMVRNLRASKRSSRGIKYRFGVHEYCRSIQVRSRKRLKLSIGKSSYYESILNVSELVKNLK